MIHQFNSSEIRSVLNVKRLSTIAKYRKKGMPCVRRNRYYYYNDQEVMEWYKNYKKKGEIKMAKVDVVLISSSGVEIARETATPYKSVSQIIQKWVLYPGDTIKIEEC